MNKSQLLKFAYAKGMANQFKLRGGTPKQIMAATKLASASIGKLSKIASDRKAAIKAYITNCLGA